MEVAPGVFADVLSTQIHCFSAAAGRDGPEAAATAAAGHPPWGTAVPSGSGGGRAPGLAARIHPGGGHAPGRPHGSDSDPDSDSDDGSGGQDNASPCASNGATNRTGTGSGGDVSIAAAAAAVTDMLAAAGLPAGADTQRLLQEVFELRQERDAAKASADSLEHVNFDYVNVHCKHLKSHK